MKHAKAKALVDVIQATGGTDNYYAHPGDSFVISGFTHGQDHFTFDSGTRVYDGILPPLGPLTDGQVFSNSLGTASFVVSIGDHDGNGIADTHIDCIVNGAIVESAEFVDVSNLAAYDIFGG